MSESPRSWNMYAHQMPAGNYHHVGTRHYVEMHRMNYPIVKVTVTEDPDGPYWGWLAKRATEPCLIWPSESVFRCCFGEAPADEEAKGNGYVLRLRVEPRNTVAKSKVKPEPKS